MEIHTVEDRIASLEARIAKLESTISPTSSADAVQAEIDESLWLIDELRNHYRLADGSVAFGGDAHVGGRQVRYQWHRPTNFLIDEAWDTSFERLQALSHPLRGQLLLRLLDAPASVADLVDKAVVSSTGSAYHHLSALQQAGWITKDSSGRYSVRPSRIVPLLTIVACTEDH